MKNTSYKYIAQVVHDLKTPLNGIQGMAQLSLMENNLNNYKHSCEQIIKIVELMSSLVRDVLDFSALKESKKNIIFSIG